MYAIVTSGGKQHKVAQGDVFRVEKLDAEIGDTVELDHVSLVASDDGGLHKVTITTRKPPKGLAGAPYLVERGVEVEDFTEATVVF